MFSHDKQGSKRRKQRIHKSHLYKKVEEGGGRGFRKKKEGRKEGGGAEGGKKKKKRHRNRKNEKIYSLSPGERHRQVSHCA